MNRNHHSTEDRAVLFRARCHLEATDPVLRKAINSIGNCKLLDVQRSRPLPALIESIIHQQLSIQAAGTIHGRFLRLYGGRPPSMARLLATDDEALRAVGLSRAKIVCVKDLARRAQDGSLPLRWLERMQDDEIINALTQVKGIGRWTAQMFLIFKLGRLDVLPVGDLGIKDAIRQLYRLRKRPDPRWLARLADPWRPYRSVACWYLWESRRAGVLGPELDCS